MKEPTGTQQNYEGYVKAGLAPEQVPLEDKKDAAASAFYNFKENLKEGMQIKLESFVNSVIENLSADHAWSKMPKYVKDHIERLKAVKIVRTESGIDAWYQSQQEFIKTPWTEKTGQAFYIEFINRLYAELKKFQEKSEE